MNAVGSCPLFAGLDPDSLKAAMDFYHAERKTYRKGAALLSPGDPMSRFGLVLEGRVQVCVYDIHGERMIMAVVTPGSTFGESLCLLETGYSGINIDAAEDTQVLWLSCDGIRSPGGGAQAHECRQRFTAMLAARALSMNDRIQVLSKHSLRKKLRTFLSQCARHAGAAEFTVDMDRADLAAYLGADRSALSRELSAMRRDGEIKYRKGTFSVLATPEE